MKKPVSAILTSVLLAISWPANGSLTPLIFIAFIPLLLVERNIRLDDRPKKGKRFFWTAYSTFAVFNLLTTWWVALAHWSGTVATTLVNGALMAFVLWIYHKIARVLGEVKALIVLPFLWISFEVFHQDWDMSFPWLDLGNVFSNRVTWIQWYEYLGHYAGTGWVWIANIAIFKLVSKGLPFRAIIKPLITRVVFFIGVPIAISAYIYTHYQESGRSVEVVVVQPNIDSYKEKFSTSQYEQIQKFISLAESEISDSTKYVVGPETFVHQGYQEGLGYRPADISTFNKLLLEHPNLNIVIGLVSYKMMDADHVTSTARPTNDGQYYDIYNSSTQIDRNWDLPIYHKSKLVVGAEKMPFESIIKPLLGSAVLDFGGIVGSHATDKERSVFTAVDDTLKVGTMICWEADFGEYATEYVRKGAHLLFAMTNDGWWGNTPGHIQHMHYARLRAIENRRDIARSANTGISCFINQRGDVRMEKGWDVRSAIKSNLHANHKMTFYTKSGDIIGRISIFISIIFTLSVLVKGRIKKL